MALARRTRIALFWGSFAFAAASLPVAAIAGNSLYSLGGMAIFCLRFRASMRKHRCPVYGHGLWSISCSIMHCLKWVAALPGEP